MKQTVEFEYSIGQEVKILAIGMIGKIQSMITGPQAQEYLVIYWNESQRCSTWLYAYEIRGLNYGERKEAG